MTFPNSTLCPLCKIFVNFVFKKNGFSNTKGTKIFTKFTKTKCQFIGVPQYNIPVKGTDKNYFVFVLLEHKTASDYWTMLQMLQNIVQTWREYKAAIVQGRLADDDFEAALNK